MSEHTKEPWSYELDKGSDLRIYSETNSEIVSGCGCCGSPNCEDADARRIVAAVNACAGIETYALELMTGELSLLNQITHKPQENPTKKAAQYRKQRDELLAALLYLVNEPQDITKPAYQRALAVIASCESAKA